MYTATITRNFRDVHTISPKVLLLNVELDGQLFRDHCWVTITPEIEPFIPYKNTQKLKISFNAKQKQYKTRASKPEQSTLDKISDISILRRFK
jgi:hypothetical protein